MGFSKAVINETRIFENHVEAYIRNFVHLVQCREGRSALEHDN